ncbi:MAG: AmmeMemoRadiSam system radical SAM enzyme [Bacillota bacterium]|nr:AmmeMemoRadiSam system radical SAM enzyme [Bacillota bacterium]
MKECLFYENLNGKIKCTLCPHNCLINEGNLGVCKQRKNINGKLISLNYSKITSLGIDPIEKKPLYHFMEGTKTFSLGSAGCNFSCKFCQNYRIAKEEAYYEMVEPKEAVEKALSNNMPSISFTYNEPTIWYEYMLETAKLAKKKNLKTICVTNGFINPEPLEKILEYIDAFNVDLKAFNSNFYKDLCGGSLEPVLNSIKMINKKAHLEITTLVIGGDKGNVKDVENIIKWIGKLDKKIPLHLSRYFPAYMMKEPPTEIDTLLELKKLGEKYLDNIYIGNVPGIK